MIRFYLFLFILFGLLCARFFFFFFNQPQYAHGDTVSFTTTLLEEPMVSSRYQSVTAYLENGQAVFVYFPRYPSFHYADSLHIVGTLNERVITNNKTIMTISFPKVEAKKNNSSFFKIPLAVSLFIRQKVLALYEKTLPEPASSLLVGIVFGIKQDTQKEFSDALRNTGVMHVVAASGTNVVLVIGFLSNLSGYFVKRRVGLLLSIFGVVLYACLAGFSASIVRAAIMGSLICVAQIFGRQYLALYGLFLTGIVMLFVSPTLLFDIGFQLSFSATLGLIVLKPLFARPSFPLFEDFTTTLAAQIATLPLLLYHFGAYSLWSILVNVLVLWTIPFLMILGGVAAFIGMLVPLLGQLLLYCTLSLLWYFEAVVLFFGKQGGIVTFITFPWQFVAGYYLCLGAGVLFVKKKMITKSKIKI